MGINSSLKKDETYKGFEQGPIRPPSEANSLLIRVTRNCPWNHCTFCPVYKETKFSKRPVDHVIKDIEEVSRHIKSLQEITKIDNGIHQSDIQNIINKLDYSNKNAFFAGYNWFTVGMTSVFLQDSNSLIIKPEDLIRILKHIRKHFPWVKRITSYARSSTITKIEDIDLKAIGDAGLNRIHIGLESGSNEVLKMVRKGATKEIHIKAGLKVKKAGIELSEYIMPGLGGQKLSKIHAFESADAINKINPEFIRLRPLAIPTIIPLYEQYTDGHFKKCSDLMIVKELLLFIEKLEGITSVLQSDHILNLFSNLEGKFPQDKVKMLKILHDFLNLKPKQQRIYQIGRRLGIFSQLDDLENPYLTTRVKQYYHDFGVTSRNIDSIVDNLMKRFI
jgi:histone acetyltransferase (RNA polymerase elongator complex component)